MKGLTYLISRITNNKKETTVLLLVIILTNAFYVSTYLYSVNAKEALFREAISEVPVHAIVSFRPDRWVSYTNITNVSFSQLLGYLEKNSTLFDVISYNKMLTVKANVSYHGEEYPLPLSRYTTIGYLSKNFTESPFTNLIKTSYPIAKLNQTEVLVSESFVEALERFTPLELVGLYIKFYLEVNDTYTMVKTYHIVGTYALQLKSQQKLNPLYRRLFCDFLGIYDAIKPFQDANSSDGFKEGIVFINFKKQLFQIDNFNKGYADIRYFKNRLEMAFQPIVSVDLYLDSVYEKYETWSGQFNSTTLYVTVPLIFVAWTVLKFEFDLSSIKRRRELSILKSRGYSNADIVLLSVTELLIYTCISVLIVMPLSNVLSMLFLQQFEIVRNISIADLILASYRPELVIFVFFVTLILLLTAYIDTLLFVISIEPVESHTFYSAEFDEMKVSYFEILILMYVFPGLVVIVLILLPLIELAGINWFFYLVLFIFSTGVFLISMKLFAVGNSTLKSLILVTMKDKLKSGRLFAKILSPYMKRRKKFDGFSIVSIFLVLLVATTTITTVATFNNQLHDKAYYYTGADMSLKLNTDNLTLIENLKGKIASLPEVYAVSHTRTGFAVYPIVVKGIYMQIGYTIVAVDKNYPKVAFLKDYFLSKGLIERVVEKGNVILMSRPQEKGTVPSLAKIKIFTDKKLMLTKTYQVIGEAKYAPRIKGEKMADRIIFMSLSEYNRVSSFSSADYFFIKLKSDVNITAFREKLYDITNDTVKDIRVAQEYLTSISSYVENRAFYALEYMIFFLMLLFVAMGQTIMFFDKYEKIRKDLAILKTIGLGNSQILQITLVDLSTNFLIALAFVGAVLGYTQISGLFYTMILSSLNVNWGILSTVDLPFVVVIPLDLTLIVLLISFVTIAISLIPVLYLFRRLNVAEEMKQEFS